MKHYVIITYDIHPVGGAQMYVAGKVRYLEKEGWKVTVLFSGAKDGNGDIPSLEKYFSGGIPELSKLPYRMDDTERNYVIEQMVQCMEWQDTEDVLVESQFDVSAFWGELLAERVHGRHYIFLINELFRDHPEGLYFYQDKLPFFRYKYLRKELIGSDEGVFKLFQGYKGICKPLIHYPNLVIEQEPIQDEIFNLGKIPSADYNIGFVGRLEKYYVQFAMEGLKKFISAHRNDIFNIVIVGDSSIKKKEIEAMFQDNSNARCVFLGILVPIPRMLVRHMDVVFAVAQTAQYIAREKVYTITANVKSGRATGVLGYDTMDSWYADDRSDISYEDLLQKVLIRRDYEKRTFSMPRQEKPETVYAKQWKYLAMSEQEWKYDTKTLARKMPLKVGIYLFPFQDISPSDRVLIYGAGVVGQDFLRQLRVTQYCTIVGVLDQRSDEFDDFVHRPEEGLRALSYDVVVLAINSEDVAEQMRKMVRKVNKTVRIVNKKYFLPI